MAAINLFRWRSRRNLRRNRIFRDRTNPFEKYDDTEWFQNYRFRRNDVLKITDEIAADIEVPNRLGTLPPLLQVMTALRFYASGTFQDVCGELIGVHQSTVCRVIKRVTDALYRKVPEWVVQPTQQEAEETKRMFFERSRFPDAIGAIDCTQVRIQAPSGDDYIEHEYVNRKNFHSINVQVVCDADLMFWNCVARWPSSVDDDRILQESELFEQFEGANRPLTGFLLGDSGYVQREWLMTPIPNPNTQGEIKYNTCLSSARTAVEKAIGVLKKRWNCLRQLRVDPPKSCKIIRVCVMLHNRATSLDLRPPSDDEEKEEDVEEEEEEDDDDDNLSQSERTRRAAGAAMRTQVILNSFT